MLLGHRCRNRGLGQRLGELQGVAAGGDGVGEAGQIPKSRRLRRMRMRSSSLCHAANSSDTVSDRKSKIQQAEGDTQNQGEVFRLKTKANKKASGSKRLTSVSKKEAMTPAPRVFLALPPFSFSGDPALAALAGAAASL